MNQNNIFFVFIMAIALLSRPVISLAESDEIAAPVEAKPADNQPVRMTSKMWWNNEEKAATLALTKIQRAEMDKSFRAFTQSNKGLKPRQSADLQALGEALAAGNEAQAREQGVALAGSLSAALERQVDMMISVLGNLTAEQRQALKSEYPTIFSRLWVRSALPRRGRGVGNRTKPVNSAGNKNQSDEA